MKITMKLLRMAVLTTTLLSVFYACDNKDDDPENYTQEESKDKLDASMTAMAENFESVKMMKSITVLDSMMDMDIDAPPFEDLLKPVSEVEGTAFEDMEDAMEQGVVVLTLSNQTQWGVYTYNFSTMEYDFTDGEVGTYIINSPSANSMTTNDIEVKLVVEFKNVDISEMFTFTNEDEVYTSGKGWEYVETEETLDLTIKELFTSIDFTIKQNSETLLGYALSATLDADNLPNKVTMALTVEDFEMSTEFDATDRTKKVSYNSSFKKDGNELFGYTLALEGDVSDERIEEITEEVETINENDELPSDEFLSTLDYNMTAELRLGDFVINGVVASSNIYDAYNNYPGDIESEEEPSLSEMEYITEELNKAVIMTLKSKNGNLVGVVDFYVGEDIEGAYYEPMMRFKFADGTYMNPNDEGAGTELEEMFADFIAAMESLSEDFEEIGDRFED